MTQPITEGYADFQGHKTWHRITGNPAGSKPPLVALHGGPGVPHNYLLR